MSVAYSCVTRLTTATMTCCYEGLAEAQRRKKEHDRSQDDAAKHERLYDVKDKTAEVPEKAARGAARTDDKVNAKSSKKPPAKRVPTKKKAPNAKQGRGAKARRTATDRNGPGKDPCAQTRAQKNAAKRKQPELATEPEISHQQPSMDEPGQGEKAATECKQQRVAAVPGAEGMDITLQLPLPAVHPMVSCLLCFTSCVLLVPLHQALTPIPPSVSRMSPGGCIYACFKDL